MRIRTRLYLGAAISTFMVIILLLAVVLTANRIAHETKQHNLAHDMNTAISELDILTYEYLLHREKRMERQWNSKYNSMAGILEKAVAVHVQLPEAIYDDYASLGDLFSKVTINYKARQKLVQEGASQEKLHAAILQEERLVAQLLIKSHSIISEASIFAENTLADAREAQELANKLVLALTIILLIGVIATFSIIATRISHSLAELTKGAGIIGKGNLDHRIDLKTKDELGELAYAFNKTTANLREITASRDELNKEVAERRRAQEELRRSEQDLAIRNQVASIFLALPDEEIYGEVLQVILERMESKYGVFGHIDEHGDLVCPSMTRDIWDKCQIPDKDIIFPRNRWGGIWGQALIEKKTLYSNEPLPVPEGHIPIRRTLVVPITYEGEVTGILAVANKPTDYDEKDIQVLETTANHIAPILYARLQKDREERARQRAEELFRTVSDNSPIGIYITQDGKFRYVNPQMQKLLGYSESELMGTDSTSYILPADRDVVRANAIARLKGKQVIPYEYRVVDKAGDIRNIMETVNSIEYQGRRAVLGNYMDITELKRLEKEMVEYKALNKFKSDLLSTVSHELRTPLAIIKGYSTMLVDYEQKLSPDEKREYLRSTDSATDRLSELVDRLLDMSRLDAGLLTLTTESTSILKLIKDTVAEAQLRAPGRKIVANLPQRPPRAVVDARRIRQVLDNLIDNACKYSEEGTEVTVSARRTGKKLLISVTDQGIGIPANELQRVFDRMYRIEQRLSTKAVGMGLGLAICKGLIEAHGGRIWMESEKGKGSTCFFTLPLHTRVQYRHSKKVVRQGQFPL